MIALDDSRLEFIDAAKPATLLTARHEPQESRHKPSTVDPQRTLAERLADARSALYGSRAEIQQKAREVREAMTASRRV
jgi:hypothetical protein